MDPSEVVTEPSDDPVTEVVTETDAVNDAAQITQEPEIAQESDVAESPDVGDQQKLPYPAFTDLMAHHLPVIIIST